MLYQLSYQANLELATLWVRNIPVEGDEYKWIYESSIIYLNCGEWYEDIINLKIWLIHDCLSCVHNCDDQWHVILISNLGSTVIGYAVVLAMPNEFKVFAALKLVFYLGEVK